MKYIPDLVFESDEQNLNEFKNALALSAENHLKMKNGRRTKGFELFYYSLDDLEQMLTKNEYPQVKGAKEVLKKYIHISEMILCSGFEHRGSAFKK